MPNQLNFTKTTYKISDFISWKRGGRLILTPRFQRRSVWKPGAKSYLIDTITRNFPIPIIFLRDTQIDPVTFEFNRDVIDGQQRLRTILGFIDPTLLEDYNPDRDSFVIQRSHNPELAGRTFNNLNEETRQSILNYEFSVHVLPPQIGDRDIIQIFRRMNSTSYAINKQEILNSQYFGEFKTSVYNLSAEQLIRWKDLWKTFSEDDISRMKETELTTELYIAIINGELSGKKTPQTIENFYARYDEVFQYQDEIERRFRICMDQIANHFPFDKSDFVFYKKTLFYTFFCNIYDRIFGFDIPTNQHWNATNLSVPEIDYIRLCSERIANRTAPQNVLEATDRRTTNPRERELLFNYLRN